MGKLEDEVAQLVEFRYGSKAAFARTIGLSEQTVYSVFKSSLANASLATVMPIAAELNLDPFQLAKGVLREQNPKSGSTEVPLYGSISAGMPDDANPVADTFPIPTSLHAEYPDAFLLRVNGTSMNRILPDGCYALVDPCSTIDHPGDPYAVAIGADEATVKLVKPLANGLMLEPCSDDPTHRPVVFDFADDKSETVSVIGRIVWYCPPADWRSLPES